MTRSLSAERYIYLDRSPMSTSDMQYVAAKLHYNQMTLEQDRLKS